MPLRPARGGGILGPGRGAPGAARPAGAHHGHGGGPEPVRLRPWVRYRKEEVYEICGALALAEALLARSGRREDAARMAAVFALAEGGLTR